jgi:hypothetical protein
MAKRKARNQTGSLTPNHGKSRINLIPLCAGGVQHVVGKLLTKATTLVEISFRSKVCTKSYSPTRLRDSHLWQFQDSHLGVLRQKAIRMPLPRSGADRVNPLRGGRQQPHQSLEKLRKYKGGSKRHEMVASPFPKIRL